ncbi:MAG: hypothetical protein V2I47_10885 [Bacteroidales bacterium]|jgi:hypothetical protein|nr:hypothetical protein [Bacteroidales bacterium]
MISILVFLVFTGTCTDSQAQRKNPLRVELNANLDMEDYNLVPCRENGLLVFFESNKRGSGIDTKVWRFAFYNKNFQQEWLADTALITGMKFKGFAHDREHTYLLFADADRQKSEYNIQILKVDYGKNIFETIEIPGPEKSQPVHFSVHEGKAFLAINNSNYEPSLLFVDLSTGQSQQVKPALEGLNIIQQLKYDSIGHLIYLVLDNYVNKKQNEIQILQIDASGNIGNRVSIKTALDSKVISEARIAAIQADTIIVLGTYSNSAIRISEKEDESGPETAGYFITRFEKGKEVLINYYNFLEFEEMFRSLSSKTVADLRKKAEKQKSRGEEYSLDYTLLLHDVIPYNGNYILLSEAYYPEYRTVTNMYYDYYGRPIPQTYTVFDGYKYISGIAASFTPGGEMVWSDGIEIRDIVTFSLAKYLESYSSLNEVALFYTSQNNLYYKITGDITGNPLQNISIENKYKGDKVMDDLGSRIIHWYGNYFICYGYQEIRNNRISGGRRTVFYFNKLAFN